MPSYFSISAMAPLGRLGQIRSDIIFYSGITPGTYTITVVSKSFSFAPRTVDAFDDLTNYDFVSTPARQSEDFLF